MKKDFFLTQLKSISPIDGRYATKVSDLKKYFSEYAFIFYRLKIEIKYLFALEKILKDNKTKLPNKQYGLVLNKELRKTLKNILEHNGVDLDQIILDIKEIEKTTNHDVKSIEYYLQRIFKKCAAEKYVNWIHFGLTSQDINNTAIPLLLKDFFNDVYYSEIAQVVKKLEDLFSLSKDKVMLAFTHGQPASPTFVGKEFKVFTERLKGQLKILNNLAHKAKFGGAVGNLNAHYFVFPNIDWIDFSNQFVIELGLERTQFTTQIEPYDGLSAQLDTVKRINTILIDLCKDVWQYISMNYFKQIPLNREVGSSTMPHKINPIDFENAEGNLLIANALLSFISEKLPISRLQRDLTDSTVLRNLGVPFAHTIIAFKSIVKGLQKISINDDKLKKDLNDNWVVVSEGIQTFLRAINYPNPYEIVKEFTRNGNNMNQIEFNRFIDKLNINQEWKEKLKHLEPSQFLGFVPE